MSQNVMSFHLAAPINVLYEWSRANGDGTHHVHVRTQEERRPTARIMVEGPQRMRRRSSRVVVDNENYRNCKKY